jgi:hypothetical protein
MAILIYLRILQLSWYIDGLRVGQSEFVSQKRKGFSVLHNFQNGAEAHRVSYPTGTGALFLRLKRQA